MRSQARLRSGADFRRLRRQGQSVANRLLVLRHAPGQPDGTRFGFSVGRKLGGAVDRNKIRRQLREHVRLRLDAGDIAQGVDVVIIARADAAGAAYSVLAGALDDLLARAGLLGKETDR